MAANRGAKRVSATVELARPGAPKELQVKFRLPAENTLQNITVNGKPVARGGTHNDVAVFPTNDQKRFAVIAEFS